MKIKMEKEKNKQKDKTKHGIKQETKQGKAENEIRKIRQPIVTVAGHIDHGKTTILDSIRGTYLAAKEAGKITQKISFTLVPADLIKKECKTIFKKFNIKLEIPGFLFIDTPGHAAFTNLRKRGGALADLAILVIDINEGIMEQTKESIDVLKASKVPFIVALNKVDAIAGWTKRNENFIENLELQSGFTKKEFEKKLYKIINQFTSLGFNSDIFYHIDDFTKQLALIPCSGKTGEGIPELVAMLAGLAQRFLKGKLTLGKEGKGTILEVKKEKSIVNIEAILYDGILNKKDGLIIATLDRAIITKIRALFRALPLGKGFEPCEKVSASAGIRWQLPVTEGIIPGMPFHAFNIANESKTEEINKLKENLQNEVKQILKLDKEGIIAKAESLGSLEALLFLLRKEGIQIKRAEIGNIKRQDIALALANLEKNPLDSVIIAFNVGLEPGVSNPKVKIIKSDIIYKIIEELTKWREEKEIEIERQKLSQLTLPCKLEIIRNSCFRQSKPAIFGIEVKAGTVKSGILLMNEKGENVDKIKGIQSEGKSIEKAEKGQEVAISLPKITFGRQIKDAQVLYSAINEQEFKKLKENKKLLTKDEISILQEIAEIKRKEKPTWGI